MKRSSAAIVCSLLIFQPLLAADVGIADPSHVETIRPHSSKATSTRVSPKETAVSLRRDLFPIFRGCTICHQDALPMGGLSLEPGTAYDQLVNVGSVEADRDRVEPGHPDKSYLLDKVSGRNALVKGGGYGMPLEQVPLTSADIDLIRRWIQQGARNN